MASRQAPALEWDRSAQLGPDVASAVHELRDRHEETHVIGSLNFAQTLFARRLFDRLTLWVYPIVLGGGKRVFDDGVLPVNFRLLEPAITSPRGAVQLRYALAASPNRQLPSDTRPPAV